eukprot:g7441.t1
MTVGNLFGALWFDPWFLNPIRLCFVFFVRVPMFFCRVIFAILFHFVEKSGAGKRLFYLPFPRDRREAEENPEWIVQLARKHGAVPAGSSPVAVRFHDNDPNMMADPDKVDQIFLVTLTWDAKGDGETVSETTLCCKSGPLRGPWQTKLVLSALGFESREGAFYTTLAPKLRAGGSPIPRCYHAACVPLLTHTFLLLEGVTGAVAVRESQVIGDRNGQYVEMFLKELGRIHKFFLPSAPSYLAKSLNGPILSIVIRSTGALKEHRGLLDAALNFVKEKCPQSLVHGDARLGNALFRNGECTIVDWECAQNGTPVFDVLYCIWLGIDSSESSALLSPRDWKYIKVWQEETFGDGGMDNRKFAPLHQQIVVVSLLLWAYTVYIGNAGFSQVWRDGNNAEDLIAWNRRIRKRVETFSGSDTAKATLVECLTEYLPSPVTKSCRTQVQNFVDSTILRKVWTEEEDPCGSRTKER